MTRAGPIGTGRAVFVHLKSLFVGFAGADSHDLGDGIDEDLSVSHFARSCRFDDGGDRLLWPPHS